jgi:hypothetical protein
MLKTIGRPALTLAALAVALATTTPGSAATTTDSAAEARTVQISVVPGGQPDDMSGVASAPVLSSHGSVVAFDSAATNLVSGDTNTFDDVFVRDRTTDQNERISVSSAGVQANADSARPSISGDGIIVAYESVASNLVPGDTGGTHIFVRYRSADSTVRVSERADGTPGNGPSIMPSISRNGRYVAFASDATNLASTPVSGGRDVLVRDLQTGAIDVASLKENGDPAGGASGVPAISKNGRYVVFQSFASDIVPGDTNDEFDVFLRDRDLDETTIISIDSAGVLAQGGASFDPEISADGQTVVFTSDASNLVPGDTNGATDVFTHDLVTGITERVSVNSNGVQGNDQSDAASMRGGASFGADISRDGRFVTFDSIATNLVPGDTNTCSLPLGQSYDEPGRCPDIFVRDRELDKTTRASVSSSGDQANHSSTDSAISDRGHRVVFFTFASNLSANDTNVCREAIFGADPGRCPDIYLHRS